MYTLHQSADRRSPSEYAGCIGRVVALEPWRMGAGSVGVDDEYSPRGPNWYQGAVVPLDLPAHRDDRS